MNLRITHLIMILVVFGYSSCASVKNQSDSNTRKIIDIEVDKLGDYYTVDARGNILKYSNSVKVYSYSNFNAGNLAALDVSNPHKILLFYKEQQIIVLLDNSLSEIGTINLDNKSFFSAAGIANDGNIWLYDSYLYKLKKIDKSGQIIEESFPVGSINPEDIIDAKIIDRDNYVIIADKNKGILLFNNLGYFEKSLNVKNVSKPTIIKDKLYYYNPKENCFVSMQLNLFSEKNKLCFDSFNIKPQLVVHENERFYLLQDKKVLVYDRRYFED